jgi:methylated-DNA-[protein]-cysteine S-methyltransferase
MKRTGSLTHGIYGSLFETGLGVGGVVAGEEGLIEVFLPFDGKSREALAAQIAGRYPAARGESPLTKQAAELLARYFAGGPVAFGLPIDRSDFTPFQWSVYRDVMAIPYGEVKSYSQVAAEIGRPLAARGIGGAMARNPLPIIIPCHRVVGKSGKMTGYSAPGGVASKQWLLETENRVICEKYNKNRKICE